MPGHTPLAGASRPLHGTQPRRRSYHTVPRTAWQSGDALSLPTIGQRAVWLPPATKPGSPVDMGLFDDWIVEVDNKSISHRPDLWGHYGMAREVAAITGSKAVLPAQAPRATTSSETMSIQ